MRAGEEVDARHIAAEQAPQPRLGALAQPEVGVHGAGVDDPEAPVGALGHGAVKSTGSKALVTATTLSRGQAGERRSTRSRASGVFITTASAARSTRPMRRSSSRRCTRVG